MASERNDELYDDAIKYSCWPFPSRSSDIEPEILQPPNLPEIEISERKATDYVFPELEQHAHDIVRCTLKLVQKLLPSFEKYVLQATKEEFEKIRNIWDLLFYFTSDDKEETRKKLFRYFSAAAIYSRMMMQNAFEEYENSLKESPQNEPNLDENASLLLEPVVSDKETHGWKILINEDEMSIFDLDVIAGEIMEELKKYSSVYGEIEGPAKIDKQRVHHQSKAGSLASKECVGNTPYLIVYRGKGREVSIRRGFELYRPEDPESKEVMTVSMHMKKLPLRFYQNGEYYDNKAYKLGRLQELVGGKALAHKLFHGKHINEVHIKLIDSFRWIYNIDVSDKKIEGKISVRSSDNDKLENLTGRKLGTASGRCSGQKDLLISFFSQILFADAGKTQNELQAFENWSFEQIRKFVEPSDKGDMYIGFCFGTLLDVGYSSQNWVTGSRNVLLLALTRGFIKLSDNLFDETKHWDPSFSEELKDNQSEPNQKLPGTMKEIENVLAGKEPNLQEVKKQRKNVYKKGLYLGSTGKGILVRIKRTPLSIICIWTLVVIAFFGFPYMYFLGEYDGKDWRGVLRGLGSILEIWGATIGIGFLLVKGIFKEWPILDMLRKRKRCQSLEELIQVMKYTEKRSFPPDFRNLLDQFREKYKLDNKRKAIALCASLPMPENIFSHYNSCAFSVDGHGEFEVDVSIDVADLTKAGYLFGVNYYGDPIVKDAKGDIRKVHFETCKNRNCLLRSCMCTNESILIGEYHPLQTNKIFHLKTKNRIVGMHKSEKSWFKKLKSWFGKLKSWFKKLFRNPHGMDTGSHV